MFFFVFVWCRIEVTMLWRSFDGSMTLMMVVIMVMVIVIYAVWGMMLMVMVAVMTVIGMLIKALV